MSTDGLGAWEVLGDASRRAIVARLSAGEMSVTALAATMPITRPAVSQHLRVLKDAGVVRDRQEGRTNVYSIDARRLAAYRRELDGFWASALGGLAEAGPPTEQDDEGRDR